MIPSKLFFCSLCLLENLFLQNDNIHVFKIDLDKKKIKYYDSILRLNEYLCHLIHPSSLKRLYNGAINISTLVVKVVNWQQLVIYLQKICKKKRVILKH